MRFGGGLRVVSWCGSNPGAAQLGHEGNAHRPPPITLRFRQGASRELLFVLTEHYRFFVLQFDPATGGCESNAGQAFRFSVSCMHGAFRAHRCMGCTCMSGYGLDMLQLPVVSDGPQLVPQSV
jgi:hypothetical protein